MVIVQYYFFTTFNRIYYSTYLSVITFRSLLFGSTLIPLYLLDALGYFHNLNNIDNRHIYNTKY